MKLSEFKAKINEQISDNSGTKKKYPNVNISGIGNNDTTVYGIILDAIIAWLGNTTTQNTTNSNANLVLTNLTTDGKNATINISGNDSKSLITYLTGPSFVKDYGAKENQGNVTMSITKLTGNDGKSTLDITTDKEDDDSEIRTSVFSAAKNVLQPALNTLGGNLPKALGEGSLKEEINRIKKLMK